MTERTVVLPPASPNGGGDASYRLTVMVPKRHYLAYLRERWWVVVATVAITIGAVLAHETLRPESYSSYAQLYMSGEVQLTFASVFNEESQTYYGTQIELLKSVRLQGAAFAKINYTPGPGEPPPVKLDITQPMKTSILVLQATGRDPSLDQRFLQALIDEYLAYKKETRRSTSEDIVASLTDQLTQKEKDLKLEQEKLAEFQRTNNVAVLQEEAKSAGLYLADLNLQLAKLKLDRELFANGLSPTTNQLHLVLSASTTNALSAGGTGQGASEPALGGEYLARQLPSEAALDSTRVDLAVKRAERDQVLSERGEIAARRLADEVARLERTVETLEQQRVLDRKAKLEALDKRIAAMEASIPALEAKVLRANERLSDAQRLKNSVQREQGFYDHLLGTLQNVDLGKNVQQERLSVLQAPTAAVAINGYFALRAGLALVFSAGVGLALVFCWYLLDDRFVSMRDIKDQFGDLVLGLVPQIRVPRSRPEACVLQPNDRRTAYTESYRHLRSALLLSSGQGRRSHTLLVTGAEPGEGKTTVAVNLARVLALGGLRVILLDADLHNEGCKQLLKNSAQVGLLDYLRGEADATAIIHATEVPGLGFVPAGTRDARGDGLFLGPRLPQLISALKAQADFVILDGAPILSADDPALLAPHTDKVLLVVRPFFSRSRLVRRAMDMLYQRHAKQVAIVLNRARKDDLAGHYVHDRTRRVPRNGGTPANAKS